MFPLYGGSTRQKGFLMNQLPWPWMSFCMQGPAKRRVIVLFQPPNKIVCLSHVSLAVGIRKDVDVIHCAGLEFAAAN